VNPYDELPYVSRPIAVAVPERLALASLLHGGPRPRRRGCRVLELGCGDATHLLSLAAATPDPDARFVGVDGSSAAIAAASHSGGGLSSVELLHADLREAAGRIDGQFDYVIAHGVFSWVPDAARDALLDVCARRLAPNGLVYLSYNARPGWDVRGLARDFLRAHVGAEGGLAARTHAALAVAASSAAAFDAAADEHPYARLMARELRFVADAEPSYVAHEFLADDNHAYWRHDFDALAARFALAVVCDADFDEASGRIPAGLPERIESAGLRGAWPVESVVDFFSYRQLHSPVLAASGWTPKAATVDELAALHAASPLEPAGPGAFRHPSGYEVEVRDDAIATALTRLRAAWPGSVRVGDVLPDVAAAEEDLRLLHRHGLVRLSFG
jgi:SAM-dependent methyltransferase